MLELILLAACGGGMALLWAQIKTAAKVREVTRLRREKEYVLSQAIQLLAIHRQRLR
jgi:hypothetical protein